MSASLLLVGVLSVVIAALSRHYNLSAPLVLVLAGLAIGWIPGLSAAELDPAEKDSMSHRGKALAQLVPALRALA